MDGHGLACLWRWLRASSRRLLCLGPEKQPQASAFFAEALIGEVRFGEGQDVMVEQADVLSICQDHLELAMPTHVFHQPGETCQVSFELNGPR